MSKGKPAGPSAEQALQTLDQLSQTIEVMSEVVDRLKRHLSRQLRRHEQRIEAESGEQTPAAERKSRIVTPEAAHEWNSDGVDLEIGTYRRKLSRKANRIIH